MSADHRPEEAHPRPASLALVFAGGTLGTAAREALSLALPAEPPGIPVTVLAINLAGAFLLGLLLDALARRGPDHGRRRTARLLVGTGMLGGFTTYSALATDAAGLIGAGHLVVGLGYAMGTVALGGIATWVGIAVAGAARRHPTTKESR